MADITLEEALDEYQKKLYRETQEKLKTAYETEWSGMEDYLGNAGLFKSGLTTKAMAELKGKYMAPLAELDTQFLAQKLALKEKKEQEKKNKWGSVLQTGLTGIGAAVGSVIPGLGTIAGAGIGSAIGKGFGALSGWTDASTAPSDLMASFGAMQSDKLLQLYTNSMTTWNNWLASQTP